MPRRKPKKINYMDMKIPFDSFIIPKARKEQEKLVERFYKEYGEDYRLNPWIDPCTAIRDGTKNITYIYEHNSFEEKFERILVRRLVMVGLKKAIDRKDEDIIEFYNSFRDLPPLPGSDNGWNVSVLDKKNKEEYERRVNENAKN